MHMYCTIHVHVHDVHTLHVHVHVLSSYIHKLLMYNHTHKATIHGATLLLATVVTRLWQPCSRVVTAWLQPCYNCCLLPCVWWPTYSSCYPIQLFSVHVVYAYCLIIKILEGSLLLSLKRLAGYHGNHKPGLMVASLLLQTFRMERGRACPR